VSSVVSLLVEAAPEGEPLEITDAPVLVQAAALVRSVAFG